MIKKIRKHIRKHINRKKLEKIKKFTNPDVIKYTFYSIGAIISIAIQIINRTFKIKNFISNDYISSFLFIVFCGGVGELIGYKLTKGINEDILKLEIDYKKLVSTYQKDKNRMVIYKEQNGNEITIPVIKLYERKINDFPTPLK